MPQEVHIWRVWVPNRLSGKKDLFFLRFFAREWINQIFDRYFFPFPDQEMHEKHKKIMEDHDDPWKSCKIPDFPGFSGFSWNHQWFLAYKNPATNSFHFSRDFWGIPRFSRNFRDWQDKSMGAKPEKSRKYWNIKHSRPLTFAPPPPPVNPETRAYLARLSSKSSVQHQKFPRFQFFAPVSGKIKKAVIFPIMGTSNWNCPYMDSSSLRFP